MTNFYRWLSDFILVVITIIWGVTFSLTKQGLAYLSPLLFIGLRFLLAFFLISPFAILRLTKLGPQEILRATIVGVVFFIGFATQTIGLGTTTASKAAFITGLSVVMVPLLQWFWAKRRPSLVAFLGSLLAFFGMTVMTISPGLNLRPSTGDLWVLACAVAFAFHIVLVGQWTADLDPVVFTTIQVGWTGLLATLTGLLSAPLPAVLPLPVWGSLFFLALIATVGTTIGQVWAQRYTTPTRTAIIFSLEPVFASLFAWLMLGEIIAPRTITGGALILIGILLAELG